VSLLIKFGMQLKWDALLLLHYTNRREESTFHISYNMIYMYLLHVLALMVQPQQSQIAFLVLVVLVVYS
jgi:hypothetical protein